MATDTGSAKPGAGGGGGAGSGGNAGSGKGKHRGADKGSSGGAVGDSGGGGGVAQAAGEVGAGKGGEGGEGSVAYRWHVDSLLSGMDMDVVPLMEEGLGEIFYAGRLLYKKRLKGKREKRK